MKRLVTVLIGTLSLVVVSAGSAVAESDIPPDVGGDVVVPPGASGGDPAGIAFTGTEVTVWMIVAAVLFVLGVGFLLAARRRARAGSVTG